MRAAYASSSSRRRAGGPARAPRRRLGLGLRLRLAAAAALHLGAPRVAHLLLARPRLRLAGAPRRRQPVGPAAGEQQRHRAEPERLHDRQRRQDRQHDQRAADDAEHAHEAREQADPHRVEADHDPGEAEPQRGEADRLRAGDADQLRGHEQRGVADVVGAVDGAGAVEEVRDLRRGADREHDRGDRAEQAAGEREVDPEAAERRAARAHRGAEVGEHEPDGHEAQPARDRGQQHGRRAVVVELVVGRAQARQRADAALAPGARQRVGEAGDGRVVEERRGGDAGADDEDGRDRRGDRGARALPGLPAEGLLGGRAATVRPPARAVRRSACGTSRRPSRAAAARGRSGCARPRARAARRRTGRGRARARRRG